MALTPAERVARYRLRHPDRVKASILKALPKTRIKQAEYRSRPETKERLREWNKKNRERLNARQRELYAINPEGFKKRTEKWEKTHPEKARVSRSLAQARQYAKDPSRSLRWSKDNPEKYKKRVSIWRSKNRGKLAAKQKIRETMKMSAFPSWANKFFIEEAYDLAARRSAMKCGGHAKWHVDHIVPLVSKKVCGLHVHNNLQVIPSIQNIKKGNRQWPDMPEGG